MFTHFVQSIPDHVGLTVAGLRVWRCLREWLWNTAAIGSYWYLLLYHVSESVPYL